MEKTIWFAYDRKITVDFSGTHEEFQKMLYVMIEQSPQLCGMLTGAVYHYWNRRVGLDCGKLGDMVTSGETYN